MADGSLPSVVSATEEILAKPNPSETEIALLVMQYVDGYTRGSSWVSPMEVLPDGMQFNEFDRRIRYNIEHYPTVLDGVRDQERMGHRIEQRLEALIEKQHISPIVPKELPQLVDQEIRKRISNVTPAS